MAGLEKSKEKRMNTLFSEQRQKLCREDHRLEVFDIVTHYSYAYTHQDNPLVYQYMQCSCSQLT